MTESSIELRGTCIFTDFSGGKQGGGCYNFKTSGGVQWAINRIPPIGKIEIFPLDKLFIQLFSFVVIACLCIDMTLRQSHLFFQP